MKTYLCVYLGSVFLGLVITPVVIFIARRLKVVDAPDIRRVHSRSVPRIGGVPIFISTVCLVVPVLFLSNIIGNRARQYDKDKPKPGVGTFRNVVMSNIVATGTSNIGCSITGLPGHPIENVSLNNIQLGFEGGGTRKEASKQVPQKEKSYPESTMFGVLPAYGFYCRNVKGLKFTNVSLQTTAADQRHALVCEDVEDALIDALDAPFAPGACAVIRLNNARGIFVCGCRPKAGTDLFLNLQGPQSERVVLMANDLSTVGTIAKMAPDVPKTALVQRANYPAEE